MTKTPVHKFNKSQINRIRVAKSFAVELVISIVSVLTCNGWEEQDKQMHLIKVGTINLGK